MGEPGCMSSCWRRIPADAERRTLCQAPFLTLWGVWLPFLVAELELDPLLAVSWPEWGES